MSLFQKSVLKKHLQSLDKLSVEAAWERYAAHFLDIAKQENIRNSKEEQYQEGFLRELFVDVLGYVLNPSPGFNLTTELKNQGNAKKADGGIVQGEKVLGVIELKGTDTVNLDKVTDQAFGYKSNQRDCRYVIVSNFERLRLYVDDATDHEEFDLFELTPDRFRLLYLLLAADYLFAGMPARMKQESALQEKDITDRFYKDYSAFKNALFDDLVRRNPHVLPLTPKGEPTDVHSSELQKGGSSEGIQPLTPKGEPKPANSSELLSDWSSDECASVGSPLGVRGGVTAWHLLLFKKSQKLLDRLLFIFFGEDKGLLPPNLIKKTVDDWDRLRELDEYRPLYDQFKKYFQYINEGTERKDLSIFAYNGGLFEPDEVLDSVKISDPVLYKYTLELSRYDFDEQVDVNILGHIFEHSLNEIEEISAQLDGTAFDKTQTKRKKDGVFYTPRYITQYIVENTVGRLCTERKAALGIVEEDFARERKRTKKGQFSTADNKTVKELAERLDAYQQWLFGLKICDPACGSGAFLNEAFDFLIREHGYVAQLRKHLFAEAIPFSVENSILERNIYGVDINEEAVEIARLSLWLRSAEPGRKLTNLSGHIKVGNSLIDDPAVAGEKAFDWEREFPEVFEQGGFDVVVGNPPYGASFDQSSKDFIKKSYESYMYKFDSYIYFIELGIKNLKKGGQLGFITPELWLRLENCENLRRYVSKNVGFWGINIFGEDVFKDAVVNAIVLFMQKEVLVNELFVWSGNSEWQINTLDWQKEDRLTIDYRINPIVRLIMDKIKLCSTKLGDFGDAIQGITPYDSYRGQSQEIIKNRAYHHTIKVDESCGKWLKGEDVERYSQGWSGEWLQYGEWLAAPREKRFFEGKRLLFREICGGDRRIQATIVNEVLYYGHSITPFILSPEASVSLEFLLAIVNSRLLSWWANFKLPNFGKSTFPKLNPNDIKQLPIANGTSSIEINIVNRVNEILEKKLEKADISSQFTRLLRRRFDVEQLPQKLEAWHELSYKDFCAELNKLLQKVHKRKLSIQEDMEWEPLFEEQRAKAAALQADILRVDREIDGVVYGLYGLRAEEIGIIEGNKN